MLDLDLHFHRPGFRLDICGTFPQPITGLFGPSGAGKTTLLRLLAGLERGSGTITADNELLTDSGHHYNVPSHRRRIGVVFQENRLFPHLNVEQNLRYGMQRNTLDTSLYDRVVQTLRLGAMLKKRTHMLSGGEGRCVALGRALLAQPRLLLLDEPFTGLDEERKHAAIKVIRWFTNAYQTRAILISHALESILALTDSLLIMKDGQLLGTGTYFDLLESPVVIPILASAGMINVIRMAVAWSDAAHTVTYCHPLAQSQSQTEASRRRRLPLFKVPLGTWPEGTELRATLNAADILLSRRPVPERCMGVHSAHHNQVAGRIIHRIRTLDHMVCVVDAGMRLLVDLARQPIDLEMDAGKTIWCTFRRDSLEIA